MMVGDSLVDIQAARSAGVAVTAATYGFRSSAELAAGKPDYLIDAFSELEEVVL
jgi:phosphoglycolate phosphatase